MPDLPEIADVAAASRQLGLAMDASELHGALCGWLAGGGTADDTWLARALADDQLPAPAAGSPFRIASASSRDGSPPIT